MVEARERPGSELRSLEPSCLEKAANRERETVARLRNEPDYASSQLTSAAPLKKAIGVHRIRSAFFLWISFFLWIRLSSDFAEVVPCSVDAAVTVW